MRRIVDIVLIESKGEVVSTVDSMNYLALFLYVKAIICRCRSPPVSISKFEIEWRKENER